MKKTLSFPLTVLFLLLGLFFTCQTASAQFDFVFALQLNDPKPYDANINPRVYQPGQTINFSGSITADACSNSSGNVDLQVWTETISGTTKQWTHIGTFAASVPDITKTTLTFNNKPVTLPKNTYTGMNKILVTYGFIVGTKGTNIGYSENGSAEVPIRVSAPPTSPTVKMSSYNTSASKDNSLTAAISAPSTTTVGDTTGPSVNIVAGSNMITGTPGSNFLAPGSFKVGDTFISKDPRGLLVPEAHTISKIIDSTHMTTHDNWIASNNNPINYIIRGNKVDPYNYCPNIIIDSQNKNKTDSQKSDAINCPPSGSSNITVASSDKTTINGLGFAGTFQSGDTIMANGETHTVSAVIDDTHMKTDAWTNPLSNLPFTYYKPAIFYKYEWYKSTNNGITYVKQDGTNGTPNLTHTDTLASGPTYSNTISPALASGNKWQCKVTPVTRAGLQMQQKWPSEVTDGNGLLDSSTDWQTMQGQPGAAQIISILP